MTIKHSEISLGQVHVPYNFEYANEAARVAAIGFVAADIGKIARQLDDNSLWMLTSEAPAAWVAIGKNSLAATDVTYDGSIAPASGSINVQEAIEFLAESKADLVDGKLAIEQLPEILLSDEPVAAGDVSYDNTVNDLGGALAVQQALDYLAANKANAPVAAATVTYSVDGLPTVDPLKPIWTDPAPATMQQAIDRLAYNLYKHLGDVSLIDLP